MLDNEKDTRRQDALATLEGRQQRRDKKKKSTKSRYSDQPALTSAGVMAPWQTEKAKQSDSSDEHRDDSDEALDVTSAKLSESPLEIPHLNTDEENIPIDHRVSTASNWAAGVIKAFLGRSTAANTANDISGGSPTSEPAARTRDINDNDSDLAQQLRKVQSLPAPEVNRISIEVERVLQRARKQLLEMDDYLSRNEEPGLRDSGIQHSDDEPPAWQAESTSLENQQSQHSNRDSLAPSLRNRRSLYEHYSPVLGKATHVEIASSTNTASIESDTTTSSSYLNNSNSNNAANSSFNNSSSLSNSTRSGPRNISLREVRENTEELEALLSQIQDLRRSTSDRTSLSQRLKEVVDEELGGDRSQDMSDLQRQSAKRYRKRPVSPKKLADHDESPEDFSSSSFENRQATPPRTSTPSPPAEHHHQQQLDGHHQQAVGRGFRLQAPPTPPKRRSDTIENVTAWTPQIEEDQRSSDIASIPSASSSHQHNRSASLPHASSSLPALVARANTTLHPSAHQPPPPPQQQHQHQQSSHRKTSSGSGADFEGMLSSLDQYRNSLPPMQHVNRRISSLSQLSQTSATYGSPVGSPLHNPPARPIPPTPTTVAAPKLPPISQQWMTPSLGEEMDQLLEAPHPPFVKSRDETMHSKRSSHDSSAESFKTAYSPSDMDDGMESEVVQDTIVEADTSGTVRANSESTSTEGEQDKDIEAVLNHEHEAELQDTQMQAPPAVGVAVAADGPNMTSSPYRTHTRNLSNMSSISSTSTSPLNFKKSSSDATGSAAILAPMKSHRRNLSTTSSVISRSLPEIPLAPLIDHSHARVLSNGSTSTVTAQNKLHDQPRVSPPLIEEKEVDKKEKKKHKKKKRSSDKEKDASGQPRPFSQTSVQQLMNLADDTFRLDELDLPPDERHLLEKFIDALSKLSVEIHMDERKKVEGKRRLQNALRAIEGWI